MYYKKVLDSLKRRPGVWLITGAAGFIGSSLLEQLLRLDQRVLGLDNFATGSQRNINEVLAGLSAAQAGRFTFVRGDILDPAVCRECCRGVDFVLHQAALGSVPRSIEDPVATNRSNIDGFLNMLVAAKEARVKRFIYAASSAIYGSDPGLPKVEDRVGRPLSPYAVTKLTNELYAGVFNGIYGLPCIGLRYFNVFGPRQDPDGAYAAVIPRWFAAMLRGEPVYIFGDGETSRDFCYIKNAVQANLLAACTTNPEAAGQVYNVAFGQRTSLNGLFYIIRDLVAGRYSAAAGLKPHYRDFRPGDVRHSLADVSKAGSLLGYAPVYSVREGLRESLDWYVRSLGGKPAGAAI